MSDAEDRRRERVRRALASPVYFATAYFRQYDAAWPEDGFMPKFAQEMLAFAATHRNGWPRTGGIVMCPPEYAKTLCLSQVYPLWLVTRARYFNDIVRILLMSEEENMAQANLGVIKWHILNNEELRADFADDRGVPLLKPSTEQGLDTWREDAIIVDRPGIVSRDMTIQAKGMDSKGVHGRRLDVFIGDDMVTPMNAGSPTMRKAALKKLEDEIQTRIVANGQLLVAGNFNDDKDLLSTLAKRPRYQLWRRPSFHVPGKPSESARESDYDKAAVTWPEVWSRERLLIEYRDNPTRFRRIHQLDPRADKGDRLNTDWMQLLPAAESAKLLDDAQIFIGCDGAIGGDTDDLDFFNLTVGALSHQHLDIVQSLDVRAPPSQQVELLKVIVESFNRVGSGVRVIGMAKHLSDGYFKTAVEMGAPEIAHLVEPITIPHGEQNKEVRLEALGPVAKSGFVRVVEDVWFAYTSDPADQPEELSMYDQWREFPYGRHDDKLDGLDIAIRAAREFAYVGPRTWKMSVAEV